LANRIRQFSHSQIKRILDIHNVEYTAHDNVFNLNKDGYQIIIRNDRMTIRLIIDSCYLYPRIIPNFKSWIKQLSTEY